VSATATKTTRPQQGGFFGHPRGLSTLFFTEMWERVSYYGMRAILLYYMYSQLNHGGLGIAQSTAASLMAIYGAAVFMSGVIGGWVADRLLGSQRSIFVGGVFIMFGHIALSLPSGGLTALYLSMVLIVLGTGLLKPNISNVVGDLYPDKGARRDAGFSIFYMSTNLGAFVAPLVVGALADHWNYHAGFSFAAFGMAMALVWYVVGRRSLAGAGQAPANPLTSRERGAAMSRIGGAVGAVAVVLLALRLTGHLDVQAVVNLISILAIVLPTGYFIVMLRSEKTTQVERSRLLAYIPLFIASVFFWLIEEQGSVVLAIFAADRTDRHVGSWAVPAAWFQSINPLAIVLLAPVFAGLWLRWGRKQPSTPRKFSAGLLFAGLSYLIMMLPGLLFGTSQKVGPFWLVASFVVVILGELCLSPVGLSATTKLAPAAFASQTMSLWFLSDAAAQGISAQVVGTYNAHSEVTYFGVVGGIVVVAGVVMYLISPAISRRMQGIL
jgi:POT family proton-dependent oligopeptide transporter